MIVLDNFRDREEHKATTKDMDKNEISAIHLILANGYIFVNFESNDEKKDIFNYMFISLNVEKLESGIEYIKQFVNTDPT